MVLLVNQAANAEQVSVFLLLSGPRLDDVAVQLLVNASSSMWGCLTVPRCAMTQAQCTVQGASLTCSVLNLVLRSMLQNSDSFLLLCRSSRRCGCCVGTRWFVRGSSGDTSTFQHKQRVRCSG